MYPNSYFVVDETLRRHRALVEKAHEERLPAGEASVLLASLLFEVTNKSKERMVEVRDYEQLLDKGPFKYSGLSATLLEDGYMPNDVFEGLKAIGIDRHIGPSYLRIKALLTLELARRVFGRQAAYAVRDHLRHNPPSKPGYVVCIPNMTGGAWIGDEIRRALQEVLQGYDVWPATPYARGARKAIDVKDTKTDFGDFVEGVRPPLCDISVILVIEELRTVAETTRNAVLVDRAFGYGEENGIGLAAVSLFDYRHPAGVGRLAGLHVDGVYCIDGEQFFRASRSLGYISELQHRTAMEWLSSPWEFTRKLLSQLRAAGS